MLGVYSYLVSQGLIHLNVVFNMANIAILVEFLIIKTMLGIGNKLQKSFCTVYLLENRYI
jgi:hypothetical protein